MTLGDAMTVFKQRLASRDSTPGQWILTGSQNLSVMTSTSQSLAGRTVVVKSVTAGTLGSDGIFIASQNLE